MAKISKCLKDKNGLHLASTLDGKRLECYNCGVYMGDISPNGTVRMRKAIEEFRKADSLRKSVFG